MNPTNTLLGDALLIACAFIAGYLVCSLFARRAIAAARMERQTQIDGLNDQIAFWQRETRHLRHVLDGGDPRSCGTNSHVGKRLPYTVNRI